MPSAAPGGGHCIVGSPVTNGLLLIRLDCLFGRFSIPMATKRRAVERDIGKSNISSKESP